MIRELHISGAMGTSVGVIGHGNLHVSAHKAMTFILYEWKRRIVLIIFFLIQLFLSALLYEHARSFDVMMSLAS